MAIIWTDDVLDAIASGTFEQPGKAGVHTGDPGDLGADDEATGGSPAYARKTLTFEVAGDEGPLGVTQPATVGVAWAEATFDLPAGDYTWLSLWSDADVFLGRVALPFTVSHVSQGSTQVSLPLGNV